MNYIDKNIRYYIDIDTASNKILVWNYGNRFGLNAESLAKGIIRIYITKGQYNKLAKNQDV